MSSRKTHYSMALNLLSRAQLGCEVPGYDYPRGMRLLAEAQVHAILAAAPNELEEIPMGRS